MRRRRGPGLSYRQHLALLRAADERFAQGDSARAIALLERRLIWDLSEVG
jgi:hypothetical protein